MGDSSSMDSMETTDSSASVDSVDNTEDGNSASIEDDNVSMDVDSEEEVDECVGLTQTDCSQTTDDDGDAECAYNQVSGDCYGIERIMGQYGKGNFDDGYNAAKTEATQDVAHLEAIIGIFGGVVVVLVCIMSAGAWYFYNKQEGGHKRIDFDDGKMTECAYGTDDDEKVNVDIVETGATQF